MISVITPVHNTSAPYVRDAYRSLQAQTYKEWEWILVPNNGGRVPKGIATNAKVAVYPIADDDPEGRHNRIGRLKNFACSKAQGEILLELDADDILMPTALRKIRDAFKDPAVVMVYTNDAEFREGTWESHAYSEYWGWRSRPFFYQGHELKEMIAWDPGPHMMRFIFWAPNHVRAWRSAAYHALGGHNRELKTGDDHELCCRFYLEYGARGLRHLNECLYLYRVHDHNSCRVYNDEVQAQTLQNYLRFSRPLAIRWAKDSGLRLLDLGGRLNAWSGFETVDLMDADITANLEDAWPFEDSSVGVIRASHIFEHLKDPVHTMNEAYRVLAPGGWLFIEVPSTDGRGAFQDPTHVSFWNENSIWYYTNRNYARFIPGYTGRFQNSRTITYFPTEFEKTHEIPIVQADLIALKPPYSDRPAGEVLI